MRAAMHWNGCCQNELRCRTGASLDNLPVQLAERMGGAEGVIAAQKYEVTLMLSRGMRMHCYNRIQAISVTQHSNVDALQCCKRIGK